MKHGSLFAGIGGFDLGFERAGIETVWQVEIEPFCRRVLEKNFPHAQRFADIRECGKHNISAVDIITAGVPCQDVSIAGKRAGLAGSRTGLFYEFARILRELRPARFLFENVPGLLSSNQGRDFAEVLRVLMVECGYGVCWRVLDSRYFNVAQRRERVFIVGSLGEPCSPEILFERESGGRNPSPRKKARQDIAVPLASGTGVTGNDAGRRKEDDYNLVAGTINTRHSPRGHGAAGPRVEDIPNLVATLNFGEDPGGTGQGHNCTYVCNALGTASGGQDDNDAQGNHIVIQDVRGGTRDRTDSGQGIGIKQGGPSYTLGAVERHGVAFDDSAPPDPYGVRDFARLPKGMDSPRYRGLGNAVTATVAEWIGKRILKCEKHNENVA